MKEKGKISPQINSLSFVQEWIQLHPPDQIQALAEFALLVISAQKEPSKQNPAIQAATGLPNSERFLCRMEPLQEF